MYIKFALISTAALIILEPIIMIFFRKTFKKYSSLKTTASCIGMGICFGVILGCIFDGTILAMMGGLFDGEILPIPLLIILGIICIILTIAFAIYYTVVRSKIPSIKATILEAMCGILFICPAFAGLTALVDFLIN